MNQIVEHKAHDAQPATWAVDPWVAMVERAARDPGVDADKMIKLYELADRARLSRSKEAFNRAMAAAKGDIGPVFKNREVDFSSAKGRTHYRHEDFAEVARTADPVLKQHGLSYRFRAAQAGKKLTVTCIVAHADGYSEETVLEAENDESGNKNSIQSIGSAATYLQRYTLKLALGLAATVDDDARASHTIEQPPSTIDADDVAHVETLIRDTGSDKAAFLKAFKIEAVEDLTTESYKRALTMFARKKADAHAVG